MLRIVLVLVFAALHVLLPHALANAQEYPSKPVRFISPYPPGGVVDIAARLVAAKLGEAWKQQVIVENRAGGGGTVGVDHAAKSAADGYTFLFATVAEFCITPHTYAKLPYDVQRDLVPVILATETPLMWAGHAGAPFGTQAEMIAHSKTLAGGLSFSSPGLGTLNHLAGERFAFETGAKLVHVPYKGGGPAGTAVAAGEVPLGMLAVSSAIPHIKSGRVKAIAVASEQRIGLGPDWPTVIEAGLAGFSASQWVGVAAPAGTPRAIIDKVNADMQLVLKLPEVRERLGAVGSEPGGSTPEEMAARIRKESAEFAKIIERIQLRLN
jgi:tripartite-type tricarboxylate transporter receptor subunit TctC